MLAVAPVQPPFVARVSAVTRSQLRYSYRPGCPVGPAQLRSLRVRYFGFDNRAHVGVLIVNASVMRAVVMVFRELYAARFPTRRMEPVEAFRGSDDRSMAADNTSAFNCRYAVAAGPKLNCRLRAIARGSRLDWWKASARCSARSRS